MFHNQNAYKAKLIKYEHKENKIKKRRDKIILSPCIGKTLLSLNTTKNAQDSRQGTRKSDTRCWKVYNSVIEGGLKSQGRRY